MSKITFEDCVLELLCSRLCHEMISPVSAINNGIELMAEESGDGQAEITGLLGYSAQQASGRLQFYRLAYGRGGSDTGPVGLAETGALVRGIADPDKVKLDWPDDGGVMALSRRAAKVILNMALLGLEALPRGGELSVIINSGEGVDVEFTATGTGAQLHEESALALATDADVTILTPRSVHAYYSGRLAAASGGTIELTAGDDTLKLHTRLTETI